MQLVYIVVLQSTNLFDVMFISTLILGESTGEYSLLHIIKFIHIRIQCKVKSG